MTRSILLDYSILPILYEVLIKSEDPGVASGKSKIIIIIIYTALCYSVYS